MDGYPAARREAELGPILPTNNGRIMGVDADTVAWPRAGVARYQRAKEARSENTVVRLTMVSTCNPSGEDERMSDVLTDLM